MSTTEQLVIHLSPEALEIARSRVASGEFASESDVIEQALLDSVLPPHDGPSEAFLQECAERYERARRDPSSLLTLDEAFEGLTS